MVTVTVTRLMTTTGYAVSMPFRCVYRCVAQIRHIQYLTYSISSSWASSNKLSLLFANAHLFKFIATDTANAPNAKQ